MFDIAGQEPDSAKTNLLDGSLTQLKLAVYRVKMENIATQQLTTFVLNVLHKKNGTQIKMVIKMLNSCRE
jgi:hypothetical protein